MKKILFFAAAASIALLSCSKTEVPQSREDFREIRIAVEAVADASSNSGQPDLKSVWKDGVGLQWSADDATRLGLAASGANLCSKALDIASSGTAEFTVDVPSGASEGLAYYPYSSSAVTFGTDQSTFSFTIASSQSQDAAGEAEYSDGKAAMTGSASLDISGGSALSAKMDIHNAFVRFLPYSATGKTEKVTAVGIAADAPLAGVISVTVSGDGAKTVAYSETSDNVSVSLTEAFDLSGITSAESSKGIYCGLIPCTGASVNYTVVTDGGTYSFVPSAAKTFSASGIVTVLLNLDKATSFTPAPSILYMGLVSSPDELNSEEKTAYEWLVSEYGAEAGYVSVARINAGYDLSRCKVIWSHLHIDGGVDITVDGVSYYNTGAVEKRYPELKTAVETKISPLYFDSGLSLLMTRYATILPGFLGFAVPNNCWGGTEDSPETATGQWTINAVCEHALYSGLADSFPASIVTNNEGYAYTNSTAQFHIGSDWGGYADDAAWVSATKGTILGKGGDGAISVWEFEPEYEVRGKILCIGSGCYDWSCKKDGEVIANDCASVRTLTKNAIDYLSE